LVNTKDGQPFRFLKHWKDCYNGRVLLHPRSKRKFDFHYFLLFKRGNDGEDGGWVEDANVEEENEDHCYE
jgi:hypothetical protein